MINSIVARETAGVTTRLIVTYVRRSGGDEAVDAVLRRAGETRSAAQLEDERNWSSYDQKIKLFAAAEEVLKQTDVASRIGAFVLDSAVGKPLRLLMRTLGSPGQVLRNVAKVSPKFSTVCTMEPVDVARSHALIRYRLHDGYRPSRYDCDYNIGLLSQAPVLFGQPPAHVVHGVCQVRGADSCVYDVRWKPRRQRLRSGHDRIRELEEQVLIVTERAEDLQSSIADLVSIEDLDELLRKIASRAGIAVGAKAYVLAVRPTHDSEVRVHSDGMTHEEAERMAAELVGTGDEDDDDARLVVEVASSRRRYGRLAALNPRGGSFFAEEKRLFAAYARNAAAALDAATALEEARQRGETAMVLLDVSRSLAKATTVDQVAMAIAEAVPTVCTGDRAAVALWDADARLATVRGWHGLDAEFDSFLSGLSVSVDDTPELYEMLAAPKARRYVAGEVGDPYVDSMMAMFGTVEMYVVPIMRSGEFLGAVICAAEERLHVTPMIAGRLSGVADLAAVAIDNVRLLERERQRSAALHVQAYRDPVTGLPNRRLFDDRLHVSISHSLRAGELLAVLYLDIDNFKEINDTLGHEAGDVLLHEMGGRLSKCLRREDTLARVGGDEFAVILPQLRTSQDAERVAMKIVAAASKPYRIAGREVRASVSVGSATLPHDGTETRMLLHKADRAMYAAKTGGGNAYRPYDETLDLTSSV